MKLEPKYRQLFYLSSLVVIAALACTVALIWQINSPDPGERQIYEVAQLSDFQTDVEVMQFGSNYWQNFPAGSVLNNGDSVFYGGDEVATFLLRDGRQVKIWPKTLLVISIVRVGNQPRFRLALKEGRMHATAWNLGVKELDIFAGNETYQLSSGTDYLDVELVADNDTRIRRYRKNGVIIR